MRVPHDVHVLVADGAKMLFFRNAGEADRPVLKLVTADEQADSRDGDLKTDAAGQKPGGSSAGETDYHQQAEDRFAVDAAAMLNRDALAHKFSKLIVIASPKTLGALRQHFHKETQARIVAEIPKDLVGHPVDKIEAALVAHDPA